MIIDHSSLIARLQVNVELLKEWEPQGEWQHNPLLLAYQRDHYCLSLSQAEQLDIYLGMQVELSQANQRYKQLGMFDS